MASHELRDGSGIRGRITFTNLRIEGKRARVLDQALKDASLPPTVRRNLLDELAGLCTIRQLAVSNRVVLAARSELAKLLAGSPATDGAITYGALGTGATVVTDADTTLDTEVARALVATATQTDDTAAFDFYFSKASVSGTFEEFGSFIGGTASADSGLLFNRALTGGWSKTTLEAMTVSVQISLAAA